jgi:hypothetical protein
MLMAASATDPAEHSKQNGRRHRPSSQLKAAPAATPTQPGPRSHKQIRLSRPPLWPSICSLRLRPAREKSRTPLVRGMLCLCLQPRLHSMPQLATQAEIRSAASVCMLRDREPSCGNMWRAASTKTATSCFSSPLLANAEVLRSFCSLHTRGAASPHVVGTRVWPV